MKKIVGLLVMVIACSLAGCYPDPYPPIGCYDPCGCNCPNNNVFKAKPQPLGVPVDTTTTNTAHH